MPAFVTLPRQRSLVHTKGHVTCTWMHLDSPATSLLHVTEGSLMHTDDSSTCLSGVVRGSGIASHRPLLKHFTLKNWSYIAIPCSSSRWSSKNLRSEIIENVIESWSKCQRKSVESGSDMSRKKNRNSNGNQSKANRTWVENVRNSNGNQSKMNRTCIETWSKMNRTCVETWSKVDRTCIKTWWKHGIVTAFQQFKMAGTSRERPLLISQMNHWRLRWCQSSDHPWHPLLVNFRSRKRKIEHVGTWRKMQIRNQHKLQHRTCCFSKKMAAEIRNQGHQFKNHFTLFLSVFTHTHTLTHPRLCGGCWSSLSFHIYENASSNEHPVTSAFFCSTCKRPENPVS